MPVKDIPYSYEDLFSCGPQITYSGGSSTRSRSPRGLGTGT